MSCRRALATMTGLAALILTMSPARATEGGGGAYGNGSEGFMAGALPPPGQYLINYNEYYHADKFKGGNGSTIDGDFKLTAWADIVRFVNVTPITILGGNWAQHIIVPMAYEDVKSDLHGMPQHQHRAGVGDVVVDPSSWAGTSRPSIG